MIKEADISYNKYIKRMPGIRGFLIMPKIWVVILFTIALFLAYGIIQHFSILEILCTLIGTGWLVFLFLWSFWAAAPTLWRMFRPKWRGWRIFLRGIYAWVANAVKVTSIIIMLCVMLLPLAYGTILIGHMWRVNISEKNIIRVYVGDEKVYEGKRAFAYIVEDGVINPNKEVVFSISEVTIYKKLFPYLVVDKTYVDKNIRVEPGSSPSK